MVSPRRRLAPEQRRRLIVEAAGRLFGERGYDGTRLDAVAAAAGVTKPVLYRHFADKRALYLALLERHRADLGSFAGAIPADGPLEARLRAVLEVWLDYVQAHSYAWRMLFRDTGGGEEVRAFRVEVHAEARAVLAGMIRHLAPRRRSPSASWSPSPSCSAWGWPRSCCGGSRRRAWSARRSSTRSPASGPGCSRRGRPAGAAA